MNLESHQMDAVRRWYTEGASLSDVQQRLKSEFGLTFTYLETRLLAEELKLAREEPDHETALSTTILSTSSTSPVSKGGGVSVTMDTVQRPGALISGRVTFSDGQPADWYIDQTGRLALNPTQPGYRPSKADITTFQIELEKLARKQNY